MLIDLNSNFLYSSSVSDSMRLSLNSNLDKSPRRSSLSSSALSEDVNMLEDAGTTPLPSEIDKADYIANEYSRPPLGVPDFDKENWDDPFQVSHYAMDTFSYMKSREEQYRIQDYMTKQVHISKWMRSLLVDWMVEVQETFELNHETLYMAVKIVDLYLSKVIVIKDKLQLLGAAALFIASKYDVSGWMITHTVAH